jgi:uncharacterized membrane protein YhaH (DUF805 family)
VSLRSTNICVVDQQGEVIVESKTDAEVIDIVGFLDGLAAIDAKEYYDESHGKTNESSEKNQEIHNDSLNPADELIENAKKAWDKGDRGRVDRYCRQILEAYPESRAAKDAKEFLDELAAIDAKEYYDELHGKTNESSEQNQELHNDSLNPLHWYFAAIKKFAVFDGRARRREYWFFVIFSGTALFVLVILDALLGLFSRSYGIGLLSTLYFLAVLVPTASVFVRRLHDTGRSGWWLLAAMGINFIYQVLVYNWCAQYRVWGGSCNMLDVPYNAWKITFWLVLLIACNVWLFALSVLNSTPGENIYGPNPKGVTEAPPPKRKREVPDEISPAERIRRLRGQDASDGE